MDSVRANLRRLPRVRDSWSYLYVEHCQIEQQERAIAIHDAEGVVPVPCSALLLLLLGPGTNVTHSAIRALAENGCLVAWTGEEGVRFYAQGLGETHSAANMERQARLWAGEESRQRVARAMYEIRFEEHVDETVTIEQLRGREGVRVREAYAQASRETGLPWHGRSFDREDGPDAVNKALSWANACLYGMGHAAIVSAGYTPALGFIHLGNMRSFVFDVADFYKAEMAIPAAFATAGEGAHDLEQRVRRKCRDEFRSKRLIERILPDIDRVLAAGDFGISLSRRRHPVAAPGSEGLR